MANDVSTKELADAYTTVWFHLNNLPIQGHQGKTLGIVIDVIGELRTQLTKTAEQEASNDHSNN